MRKSLLLILLLSLLLNSVQAFVLCSPIDHIYSDMGGYIERARRLVNGAGRISFDAFYPAGTTYFYAIFFKTLDNDLALRSIVLAQVVLLSLSNVLIGLSVSRLFANQKLGTLVAFATAVYWPFTAQASFYMAEPLFIFLLNLSLFIFATLTMPSGKNAYYFLLLGLTVASASLVKGQGLALIPAYILGTIIFCYRVSSVGYIFTAIALFLVGTFGPIIWQAVENNKLLPNSGFSLAANDAYNMYLGQSRHKAIGCLDTEQGYFYIFHNNNSGLDFRFNLPVVLNTSIVDRQYFREKTKQLWREDPTKQLYRSLQNMIELFHINPHWPARNVEKFRKIDILFQQLLLVFVLVPAIWSVLFGGNRAQTLFLASPIVVISLLCGATMGQPRYLIPFHYFSFALAAPFYLELSKIYCRYRSGERSSFLRFLTSVATCGLLVFLSLIFGNHVTKTYDQGIPALVSNKQTHYNEYADKFLYWVEFGKDAKLLSVRKPLDGFDLRLVRFRVGPPWQRSVYWHIDAIKLAEIELKFPPSSIKSIYLFMTDGNISGNTHWRTSQIVSDGRSYIADKLHNGRWIKLDVSEKEAQLGIKKIELKQLTGDSIAISALAAS